MAMWTPFVIDNQQHKLADVLNPVLARHAGRGAGLDTDCVHGYPDWVLAGRRPHRHRDRARQRSAGPA